MNTICQACGYDLDGLPDNANCPECGTPVSVATFNDRIGTPWQRDPGLFAWSDTVRWMFESPTRTFAIMRLDPVPPRYRLLIIAWVAGAGPLFGAEIVLSVIWPVAVLAFAGVLIAWLIGALIGVAAIDGITFLITRGRVTPERRRAVAGHAAMVLPAVLTIPVITMVVIGLASFVDAELPPTAAITFGLGAMWLCLPIALIAYAAMIRTGLRHSRPIWTGRDA